MNLRSFFVPVSLSALLASCGPLSHVSKNQQEPSNYLAGLGVSRVSEVPANPAEWSSFWDGDSVSGSPLIKINRAEQKAYFYKSGQLVGVAPVSTGDSTHTTPAGSFKVSQKDPDYSSSTYGTIVDAATGTTIIADADSRKHKPRAGQKYVGAPMPYFLRFNHGIGMHAGHLPGYAASHGCVRMPRHMAQKFFENAEIGTPVIVE